MSSSIRFIGGTIQLALDLAGGVLRTVEQAHATIAKQSIPWTGLARTSRGTPPEVAGQVYALLRGGHQLLAMAVAGSVRSMAALPLGAREETFDSIASAAILNGVCGDHLEATQNPLAIPMSLRRLDGPIEWTRQGVAGAFPRVSPRIVVWVHGLCLSEQNWVRREHPPMGEHLSEDLGAASVYARYNSGRRISTNGRELSDHLERMIEAWPVPVESLTLIGHSMGGLVIRSAGYYGDRDARAWRTRLRNVVCLGTPHHGASLERVGNLFTLAMQASPYVQPFAFGSARSAGIKDLRHGNLLDEDWQGARSDEQHADARTPIPLLAGVDHYFGAATMAQHAADPRAFILGDLLVTTNSALGAHADAGRRIAIAPENCRVFRGMNHFDLLGNQHVYRQLVEWMRRNE